MKIYSLFPNPDLNTFKVVAQPEEQGEGFWVGGCSSLYDKEKIWLVYRLRNPKERGHRLCIALSKDASNFQIVKIFSKEDFENIKSLERASILQDPFTGKYKLYISLEKNNHWYIYKLSDVATPKEFDPSTAKCVLSPSGETNDNRKVKDPYIINFCNIWHMFYSGSGKEPQEETYLATSLDGVQWERQGKVLFRKFWHDYHTRISCIIPTERGFVYFYEGSSSSWYKPHFNLNIGYGYSADMRTFHDFTIREPTLSSPTGKKYFTIRYMDYVLLKDKIIYFYEAANNDSFELRTTECRI